METAVTAITEIIAPALFDYAQLDTEARIVIQQRAGEIRTIAKRVGNDIVEIGGKLAEVKTRLGGSGKFSAWLETEFGWSERTVANWIAVWQRFNGENFAIENVATSALYLLAAPSTPAEAVEAAKALADQGETVTRVKAETIVKAAKAKAPKQVDLLPEGPTDEEEEAAHKASAGIASPAAPAASQVIAVPLDEMFEIERCCVTDPRKLVEPYMRGVDLYLITHVSESLAGQPFKNAIGWQIEMVDTPKVVLASDRQPRVTEDGEWDWIGVLVNCGTVERPEWYRVTGPQVRFCLKAASAQLPEAESSAPSQPAAWENERVEISIALLPPHDDGLPREVLYSVIVGERVPFYDKEEAARFSIYALPYALQQLVAKQLASLCREEAEQKPARSAKKARANAVPDQEIERSEDDLGGTPVATALPQTELDRIMGFCCPQKIASEEPVRLCHVNGGPYVITGCTSSGKRGAISVNAWAALPLANVGQENAKTYAQVSAEYAKQFQDLDEELSVEFTYKDMKVNCGTKKKPDWWVMVGPEIVFTADYAADYPDDEIEAASDDDEFTATRCEECGRIDGAHAEGCEAGASIPRAIYLAFLRAEGCRAPMRTYREISATGERDAEIRVWVAAQNQAMAARGGVR